MMRRTPHVTKTGGVLFSFSQTAKSDKKLVLVSVVLQLYFVQIGVKWCIMKMKRFR